MPLFAVSLNYSVVDGSRRFEWKQGPIRPSFLPNPLRWMLPMQFQKTANLRLYIFIAYITKTIYLFIKLFDSWYICTDNLQRGSQPPTIAKASITVRAPATIETGTHIAAKITVEISLKQNEKDMMSYIVNYYPIYTWKNVINWLCFTTYTFDG